MYIIETDKLTFNYKDTPVLHDVNLKIPEGSIYGYLGRNGAGKSTTIKLLLGVLKSDGNIFYNGKEFNTNRELILGWVGNLVEAPSYYSSLTGSEHLEYLNIIYKQRKQRIADILDMVGLSQAAQTKVSKYSTGMKQRLGIAMAIFNNPDILILDEPLNGLDPEGVHDIRNLMFRLKSEGKTILLSSHILGEIEKVCSHIGILENGELLYQGELSGLVSTKDNDLESVYLNLISK